MAKNLTSLTTEELKQQMSIAGNPNKVMQAMTEMWNIYTASADTTNAAEMINFDLVFRRMQAENKLYLKMLEGRTGQKYKI